jgi:G2/mitotic-specific cyclin-B, other
LVGIASLFIASKYEEIYPPHLRDFVDVTDRFYSKLDVLDMESKIM